MTFDLKFCFQVMEEDTVPSFQEWGREQPFSMDISPSMSASTKAFFASSETSMKIISSTIFVILNINEIILFNINIILDKMRKLSILNSLPKQFLPQWSIIIHGAKISIYSQTKPLIPPRNPKSFLKVEEAKDIPNMESWISSMYDKKVTKTEIGHMIREGGWGIKEKDKCRGQENSEGWKRIIGKIKEMDGSSFRMNLRMSPTPLLMFGWATLGLPRPLWSTMIWTRCGMRSSELRFVLQITADHFGANAFLKKSMFNRFRIGV